LSRLVLYAFLVRFAVVVLFWLTDAIFILRLSPDSERYHRVGLDIMREMEAGIFNWPNWIDNAWFQFTGLVYYLLWPSSFAIQMINISLSSATVAIAFYLTLAVTNNPQASRITAFLVAFFPSMVYWSCLMLKDTAAVFAMTMLVYGIVMIKRQFEWRWLAMIAVGLLIYLGIREYLFFVSIGLVCVSLVLFPAGGLLGVGRVIVPVLVLAMVPYLLGYGYFGIDYSRETEYFDLEYINHVRTAMGDHGTGAFYDPGEVRTWGEEPQQDILTALTGIFFFFVTLDLTSVDSTRQIIALPEVLLFLVLIPSMFRGIRTFWAYRETTFPVLVFAFGVMAVYVVGTTNMGAMFRWKMQIMPLFLMFITVGLLQSGKGVLYRFARAIA
jgi:hypothetical protein